MGLTLALSPDDPLLELSLDTNASGASFGRELLRLGEVRNGLFSPWLRFSSA